MKFDNNWKYSEKIREFIYLHGNVKICPINLICDDQYTKDHLRADLIKALSNMVLDEGIDSEDYALADIIRFCIIPQTEFNFIAGLEDSFIQNPCRNTQLNILHLSGDKTRLWQDKGFRDEYKASGLVFGVGVIPDDIQHDFLDEIVLYEKIKQERATTESFREKNGIDTMSMAERVDLMWRLDDGHLKYRRTLGVDKPEEDFSGRDITDIYRVMKSKKAQDSKKYQRFANLFLHDVDKRIRQVGAKLLHE